MALRDYSELRLLKASGIDVEAFPQTEVAVSTAAPSAEEPSPSLDRQLLAAAQALPDPLPLLALRCRVSHPLEAWLQGMHRQYGQHYGLDLLAMASYGLDDDGRLSLRRPDGSEVPFVYEAIAALPSGLISPFGAEVIRTYDPQKCGLPHWARLKIQAHNGLKAYLKEQGRTRDESGWRPLAVARAGMEVEVDP